MKIGFTQKEYQRLLELVHLGMWTVTAYQGDNSTAAQRYNSLDQRLLDLAREMGCADLAELRSDGLLQPSNKLLEDVKVREIQSEFSNDLFWHELVMRLAERDFLAEQVKRSLNTTPGIEPLPSREVRIKQLEEKYWQEFEKHDLTNVIVLRGAGKG